MGLMFLKFFHTRRERRAGNMGVFRQFENHHVLCDLSIEQVTVFMRGGVIDEPRKSTRTRRIEVPGEKQGELTDGGIDEWGALTNGRGGR